MQKNVNHPATKTACPGKLAAGIPAKPGITGLASRSAALLRQLRREAARSKHRST